MNALQNPLRNMHQPLAVMLSASLNIYTDTRQNTINKKGGNMAFKCKIGLHSWNGCKCSECGKIRDEQHDWSKDCEKCSKCGKTKEQQHKWKGCKCSLCGKIRDAGHDWRQDCEKCSICGAIRKDKHNWSIDCEKCSNCNRTRIAQHDWTKNCEKCSKCDVTRKNYHKMDINNFCTVCGKTTSLQLICEKCKESYILGIEAISITSEETAQMLYMVIGNMPKSLMIGHGDRNNKNIIAEALFTAKKLGPQRGWQCNKCHNTNSWNPIVPNVSMIKPFEPKIESKKEAVVKVKPQKPIIEWVDIPAGTFIMGCPKNEVKKEIWESDYETQHKVKINAFKMSKFAITFEQYDLFCETFGIEKPYDENWGRGKHPVINVSWNDANKFAQWMDCRLPTEAEWEYACRAGTTTPYNTGKILTASQARFNDSTHSGTFPVGSFAPNKWGLYDMHGNVDEWCYDWLGDYPTDEQNNPSGPSTGNVRIFRGGGWSSGAKHCRSASRYYRGPNYFVSSLGFRLVSTI